MNYQTILFDLDGTLTDPKEGITKCVAYGLRHFGIQVDDLDVLERFIGPPLTDSFSEYYGLDEEQTRVAIEKYRDRFNEKGWAENIPYPGAAELLKDLRAAGKTLAVATSKPEQAAIRILQHFGMADDFHLICGAPLDNPAGSRKSCVIRDALARLGVTDLTGVVMVGDRHHDVDGAHEVGLPAIGVLYGYGDRPEHEAAGAEYIAEDIPQLRSLLLG